MRCTICKYDSKVDLSGTADHMHEGEVGTRLTFIYMQPGK